METEQKFLEIKMFIIYSAEKMFYGSFKTRLFCTRYFFVIIYK